VNRVASPPLSVDCLHSRWWPETHSRGRARMRCQAKGGKGPTPQTRTQTFAESGQRNTGIPCGLYDVRAKREHDVTGAVDGRRRIHRRTRRLNAVPETNAIRLPLSNDSDKRRLLTAHHFARFVGGVVLQQVLKEKPDPKCGTCAWAVGVGWRSAKRESAKCEAE
jgi:hypothetical protein